MGLSLLVTTAAPELRAQGPRVDGIVRDASGASIPGIEVKLHRQTFTSSRVTDSAGVSVFERLPATEGTITIRAQCGSGTSRQLEAPLQAYRHSAENHE